jgi:hypothetical protein
MKVDDKVIIFTGAGSGLGLESIYRTHPTFGIKGNIKGWQRQGRKLLQSIRILVD